MYVKLPGPDVNTQFKDPFKWTGYESWARPFIKSAQTQIYVVVYKIFWTDAVKIIKLTIKPIGHYHLHSTFLPHVDTSPTISSIFGTLPGSPFLSECQAVSAIWPGFSQWYYTGVPSALVLLLEIGRSHRVLDQGVQWVGDDIHFVFNWKLLGEGGILGTSLAATRCMPISFIRTCWHVP
jgi:hypothetical protein